MTKEYLIDLDVLFSSWADWFFSGPRPVESQDFYDNSIIWC